MSTLHFGNVHDEDFAEFLTEAKAGSAGALGSLLEMGRAYLTDLASRLLPRDLQSKQDEEDLVQNTLLAVAGQVTAFEGTSPQAFRAWLRALLLNDFRDFCRGYRTRQKRRCGREVPLDCLSDSERERLTGPLAAELAEGVVEEARQLLHWLLNKLEPKDREIVRLHWLEGIEFEEIGARLHMSRNAAQKRCARAMAMLSRIAREEEAGEGDW